MRTLGRKSLTTKTWRRSVSPGACFGAVSGISTTSPGKRMFGSFRSSRRSGFEIPNLVPRDIEEHANCEKTFSLLHNVLRQWLSSSVPRPATRGPAYSETRHKLAT